MRLANSDLSLAGIARFSTFIQDMNDRGLLDETLVVCMSEFGRTPKINAGGGRDHWARAGSMLFAGAGVHGGSVVGATDKQGAFVTDRPCSPADVAWTIYDALGIDPRTNLRTPDGSPVRVLDQGAHFNEIFA